jgi:hypothetical protein
LGEPLVEFPLNVGPVPIAALSTVPLDPSQIGRDVVLSFERGELRRPVILGILMRPGDARPGSNGPAPASPRPVVEVERDGERLELSADRELILRCGEASITLTRAGKILIRGTYLLSRSSGVNRIKGGSVQIN